MRRRTLESTLRLHMGVRELGRAQPLCTHMQGKAKLISHKIIGCVSCQLPVRFLEKALEELWLRWSVPKSLWPRLRDQKKILKNKTNWRPRSRIQGATLKNQKKNGAPHNRVWKNKEPRYRIKISKIFSVNILHYLPKFICNFPKFISKLWKIFLLLHFFKNFQYFLCSCM